jgi:N-glycosylase/DNA lyase
MNELIVSARDYDLAATLSCGQAFRWDLVGGRWQGVVAGRWVQLHQANEQIHIASAGPQSDWNWITHYLQSDVELDRVMATFPEDEPMRQAIATCRGLRLLRQSPWECLASFILSSTKQIVQIRQIVSTLCSRHGSAVAVPQGIAPAYAFPTAEQISALSERELRDCKMGFRAPYLLAAARAATSGELDLNSLANLPVEAARAELIKLPGVGPKIADCVLLFAYGFPTAFPVDVWVMKALRQSYFRNRNVSLKRLREFSATHFGPHGGYAQQYLFHSLRVREGKSFREPPRER